MPDSGFVTKKYKENKKKELTEKDKHNAWASSLVGGRKSRRARKSRKSVHRKSNRRSVARRSVAHRSAARRSRKSRSSRKNRK
jgi:hypothetical protein